MVKKPGWIQNPDDTVPLAYALAVSVTEVGLQVGIQFKWSSRTWKLPEDDTQVVQIGIDPKIAREVAQALLQSANEVEAGTGMA